MKGDRPQVPDDRKQMTGDGGQVTDDRRRKTSESDSPQSSPTGLRSPVPGPSSVPGPRSPVPQYKFQSLQVYQLALDYLDRVYEIAYTLPGVEKFNLRSQVERAATSVVLNIAEGSTGQSDPEQSRFTSMALRSYLETVACFDIAERRRYVSGSNLQPARESGHELFVKLSALRRALSRPKTEDR